MIYCRIECSESGVPIAGAGVLAWAQHAPLRAGHRRRHRGFRSLRPRRYAARGLQAPPRALHAGGKLISQKGTLQNNLRMGCIVHNSTDTCNEHEIHAVHMFFENSWK